MRIASAKKRLANGKFLGVAARLRRYGHSGKSTKA